MPMSVRSTTATLIEAHSRVTRSAGVLVSETGRTAQLSGRIATIGGPERLLFRLGRRSSPFNRKGCSLFSIPMRATLAGRSDHRGYSRLGVGKGIGRLLS